MLSLPSLLVRFLQHSSLHSNTPIPKDIKDWLDKKGISSYEHQ